MKKLYLISPLVWPVFLKIQRLLLFHNLRNQYVFLTKFTNYYFVYLSR